MIVAGAYAIYIMYLSVLRLNNLTKSYLIHQPVYRNTDKRLTLSLLRSTGTFSPPFKEKCISEVLRNGSIIN